jgi:catechol 2,3-dioxygenase-like lactoylglutathione lyase family enzyme
MQQEDFMNVQRVQTHSKPLDHLPERLHHFGFVVKDQEANRRFFEDVLGIPLVATWCERAHNVIVGREINYCHTFYALADGGALAFFQFEDADAYEKLKPHRPDLGHHFAMKVGQKTYDDIVRRLKAAGIEYRETDHGYCQSIYMASPDGLKVEFTVDPPDAAEIAAAKKKDAHSELKRWLAGDRRPNNTDRHGVTA